MDETIKDAYGWAAVAALLAVGIETYHLVPEGVYPPPDPWGQPILEQEGPTTLTLALVLVNPTKTNIERACRLGRSIEAFASRALGLGPGDSPRVRVTHDGGYLLVDFERPDPYRPTFPELEELAQDAVLLGLDQFNNPVLYDLEQHPPGLGILAAPGGGKTMAARLIAAQALARGWAVGLVDLKGGAEWEDFEASGLLTWGMATDNKTAQQVLQDIENLCARRGAGQAELDPPLLLVFDEVLEADKASQAMLARLLRLRRSARLRTIWTAQRAGEEIPQVIRSVTPHRLVGMLAHEWESDLATIKRGLNCHELAGAGDMLLVEKAGQKVTRLQVARAEPEDLGATLAAVPGPALPPVKPGSGVSTQTPDPAPPEDPKTVGQVLQLLEWQANQAPHPSQRPVPPPAWLLARAVCWAQRRGQVPSHRLISEWHKEREGTDVTPRRRKVVREWAARLAALKA